jgi:hypothetical protein
MSFKVPTQGGGAGHVGMVWYVIRVAVSARNRVDV